MKKTISIVSFVFVVSTLFVPKMTFAAGATGSWDDTTPSVDQTSASSQNSAGLETQTSTKNSGSTTNSPITLENPLGGGICKTPGNCLQDFLQSILQLAIRIGTIVIILMIIYIGFMFVTARGEPAKISTARTALLWTVVGALILLGAQAIASGIQATVKALGS